MMKKIFFTRHIALFLFFGALTFTNYSCNNNPEEKLKAYNEEQNPLDIPQLLDRKGELANAVEWGKTKSKVAELRQKIALKPEDVKLRLQMATIFIAEQRITGEHHFYYTAIQKILDGVLMLDPKNFDAIVYKASVKMSLHQFAEAKALAESAKAINPDNAYVYGILVDANVELGNYQEAIAMSDKMQSLKPSLESYSRASYLREIFGDYNGAIAAMKLAVDAGLPGSEPQSWSRNILAELYSNTNQTDVAEKSYKENLALRPSYAPSMAGLSKIAVTKKEYPAALAWLDSAKLIQQDLSFDIQQADIYSKMGDSTKAKEKYEEVRKALMLDASSGHSVSLDLARLFIKTNQWDSAMKYAMIEYNIRPKNIDVNKELAWIAYNEKDKQHAGEYLKTAMSTNSKNPELLQRAAMINKN